MKRLKEINDDEIRIISSANSAASKRRTTLLASISIAVTLLAAAIICLFCIPNDNDSPEEEVITEQIKPAVSIEIHDKAEAVANDTKAFTVRTDTVVKGIELCILTPVNATPSLVIGNDIINDSSVVLIAQAADIRGDNGAIVGSFISKGKLISKSESKSGFCSIINGDMSIGVADATPMFEQALMSDGDFFRQYPLVVAGQIVENKPKGKSIRKAIAEVDGRFSVVMSRSRLTMHDFSQALADAGFRNAIYLEGGKSFGSYTDADGSSFTFGPYWDTNIGNVNYLVWR